jgi:3-oxoacyl-[acyl-carrier-protein] synthase II
MSIENRGGARIYAVLVGFGMSRDAYHMTSPPEDGRGAEVAPPDINLDNPDEGCSLNYMPHAVQTMKGEDVSACSH